MNNLYKSMRSSSTCQLPEVDFRQYLQSVFTQMIIGMSLIALIAFILGKCTFLTIDIKNIMALTMLNIYFLFEYSNLKKCIIFSLQTLLIGGIIGISAQFFLPTFLIFFFPAIFLLIVIVLYNLYFKPDFTTLEPFVPIISITFIVVIAYNLLVKGTSQDFTFSLLGITVFSAYIINKLPKLREIYYSQTTENIVEGFKSTECLILYGIFSWTLFIVGIHMYGLMIFLFIPMKIIIFLIFYILRGVLTMRIRNTQ